MGVRERATLGIDHEARSHTPRLPVLEVQEGRCGGLDRPLHPILKASLLGGLRQGEILSLRWEQIDAERGLLFVSPQTKTHKGREIPLLPELQEVLDSVTRVIVKGKPAPYVFTNPESGTPYKGYDVTNGFKRAARQAGLSDLRFHDLRRTFASRLAQRGVSLQAIARLLGHGATYVTERYAHLSADDLREAMGRLARPAPADRARAARTAQG